MFCSFFHISTVPIFILKYHNFICRLFKDAFSKTNSIQCRTKSMISEWRIGKDLKRSGRGLMLRCYPGIRLERLRTTMKNLSQGSRSPCRDLKPGPPDYEAEVSSTNILRLRNKQIPSLATVRADNSSIITYFPAVPHLNIVFYKY
jgi:hypothetical protein